MRVTVPGLVGGILGGLFPVVLTILTNRWLNIEDSDPASLSSAQQAFVEMGWPLYLINALAVQLPTLGLIRDPRLHLAYVVVLWAAVGVWLATTISSFWRSDSSV